MNRRAVVRGGTALGLASSAVAPLLAGSATSAVAQEATPAAGGTNELVLGALLALSEGWTSLGIASKAALSCAADDINAEFQVTGSPARVRVEVKDTRLQPDLALEQAQALADNGVPVVIGPQSSAEVAALKEFTDSSGLIVISQGSTASSLAYRGDNIFRVVPTDVPEVEALITLLEDDGIEVIVPIWLDDAGNASLHDSMARLFPEHGGTVLDGVPYPVGTEDFSEALDALSGQVAQATGNHDAANVGVYLATFEDVTPLFTAASQDPVLSSVRWYGTNGAAHTATLPEDADAAAFAVAAGYPCPLLGLNHENQSRWQPVAERVAAITGETPDAFSLAAYDAAWIATLAYLETGMSDDPAALQAAIPRTADRYYGITGLMELNEAGDRKTGEFDFWAVRETGDDYSWVEVAHYSGMSGELTRDTAGPAEATPAS